MSEVVGIFLIMVTIMFRYKLFVSWSFVDRYNFSFFSVFVNNYWLFVYFKFIIFSINSFKFISMI